MTSMIKRLPPARALLAILFLFVQMGGSLCLPYVTAQIVNRGVISGDIGYIWSQGAVMIGLSAVSLLGAAINTLLFSQISYKLGEQLRLEIYTKALSFSKSEFDRFGASSLITRNTNDVTQVQNLVEMGLKFLILAPIQLIGGIIMTWLLSPTLAFVSLCAIPFLAVSTVVIYRLASPLYVKIQTLLDQLNLYFKEGLTGVKVIRAFHKEQADYEKYRQTNRGYTSASITAGTIMSFFMPVFSLLISIATLVIVWLGGSFAANGTLEVGSIIGALSYSAQILSGFAMLTQIILGVPRGQTSAKRICEVLDTPAAIRDPEDAVLFAAIYNSEDAVSPASDYDPDETAVPAAIRSPEEEALSAAEQISLSFEDVDFRYFGAEKKTLSGIDFTVYGGQTLAIIGSTGDGKSTLVNLISRLYDVEHGCVRLSGADIRSLTQNTLHDKVSFAPQASTLFLGTVRSNLLIGKPDATDEELWAALDMAQAGEFVRTLDKGLDSAVEKAGGNFSGGQKQRLCIARALLKKADVYVFDDSFSALDFKTDAAVRTSMRARTKDAVTVIVAQRISTVMNADLIAVLDGGVLAGLGTHEELKAQNPIYQQILDSQTYKEVA